MLFKSCPPLPWRHGACQAAFYQARKPRALCLSRWRRRPVIAGQLEPAGRRNFRRLRFREWQQLSAAGQQRRADCSGAAGAAAVHGGDPWPEQQWSVGGLGRAAGQRPDSAHPAADQRVGGPAVAGQSRQQRRWSAIVSVAAGMPAGMDLGRFDPQPFRYAVRTTAGEKLQTANVVRCLCYAGFPVQLRLCDAGAGAPAHRRSTPAAPSDNIP